MAPRRKRDTFKGWLSRFFSPKAEVRYTADGRERQVLNARQVSREGSSVAHKTALHNPAMTSVQGDHNTVNYVQGDRTLVPQIMNLLSQHIIRGAAHDSSARTPPPRCHPETRVKIIARITEWFDGQGRQESVLWITGPAGVGKSAVVQTFAEHLVKLELLGASVFFSRPNRRNNPHGVFITIVYQLATRIEAYRDFVVERLSHDPELLHGDMQTQFTAFIVEPFVEKKIGRGGRRVGILLDGLDELDGEDAQCEIIHLTNGFVRDHHDTPLVWILASRPESHISNTFDDDNVRHSCWSEHIPIDSTEACEDVERFLRSSFGAIQKKYRRSMPNDWPSNTDFLKITAAASGLFVYAEVVVQFIRDTNHADPVSRLKILLSIIDHSNCTPMENPFVHLDALYHQILSSIPSNLWPTAKRLLGFLASGGDFSSIFHGSHLETPRGMSILFGLNLHLIYACVTKCRSTLRVPDWKVAHKERLMILHASFADYLKDSRRSGEFYVGSEEDIDEDMALCLLTVWNLCSEDHIGTVSVEAAWHQYCSKRDDKPPSRAITKFHANLSREICSSLSREMDYVLAERAESLIWAQLYKINVIKLPYYLSALDLSRFVRVIMTTSVENIELLRRIQLGDLKFVHLDWKTMIPACAQFQEVRRFSAGEWKLRQPRARGELEKIVSELESLRERTPELEVVIIGGVPEGRIAAFCSPFTNDARAFKDFVYYLIPYRE